MSQIVGYRRTGPGLSVTMTAAQASVERIDHKANGALDVATYPGVYGERIVTGGNITYTGHCAPGHTNDTGDPIWRIKKVTASGGNSVTEWATVPEDEYTGTPVKYAGFDHIWDNRASLTYK